MSSDFLDNVDDDENGVTVLLTIKASGDAFLTVSGDQEHLYYHLAPNNTGWENAERIVAAISNWLKHTKQINQVK